MCRSQRDSKSALSYWFPKLHDAGLPVPKTQIIRMTDSAEKAFCSVFDGEALVLSEVEIFFEMMDGAIKDLGSPCFIRTDHTSAKHSWKDTCFYDGKSSLLRHVLRIIEFSEMADMMGLPWDTWAVREYLSIMPFGICPEYKDMPVCKEFRFFVNDGDIQCFHPYWPPDALEKGGLTGATIDLKSLYELPNDVAILELAKRAGKAFPGSWSIDILETRKGWYITDMAEAHRSWHQPECQYSDTPREEKHKDTDPAEFLEKIPDAI